MTDLYLEIVKMDVWGLVGGAVVVTESPAKFQHDERRLARGR